MSYKTHHVLTKVILGLCPNFARHCERYTEEELYTIVQVLEAEPKTLRGLARTVRVQCEAINYGKFDAVPPTGTMLEYLTRSYRVQYAATYGACEAMSDREINEISIMS